ncbi:MAG: ferrochelatase [bacterium]|nr:ferrochelatase [bacterium]
MSESETKIGVLLVNLGTPRSPGTADVRRYLREFLSDPAVIDTSAATRWLLVNTIIAPFRAPRSAALYRSIWGAGGRPEDSPLLAHGLALRGEVARQLGETHQVELAMRYGEPSIEAALERLAGSELSRIVLVPLFPQYASSSSGSTIARVFQLVKQWPELPGIDAIEDFFVEPGWIGALAAVSEPALESFSPDHVLMSYHGLPERQIRKLDVAGKHCLEREDCCDSVRAPNRRCYRAQCYATSRALAAKLGLSDDDYSVAFQSRLGRAAWIRPYTDETLPRLAARGVKRLAVLCPSFVADCLETLEEIGMRARQQWLDAGGEALRTIPCVNEDERWAIGLAQMVRSRGQA